MLAFWDPKTENPESRGELRQDRKMENYGGHGGEGVPYPPANHGLPRCLSLGCSSCSRRDRCTAGTLFPLESSEPWPKLLAMSVLLSTPFSLNSCASVCAQIFSPQDWQEEIAWPYQEQKEGCHHRWGVSERMALGSLQTVFNSVGKTATDFPKLTNSEIMS